jgi:membrane-anchored glycerophosphoryl diester phosphodiesterase (GDPDase)
MASENNIEFDNCDNNLFQGEYQHLNSVVLYITDFIVNFSSPIGVQVMFWLPLRINEKKELTENTRTSTLKELST